MKRGADSSLEIIEDVANKIIKIDDEDYEEILDVRDDPLGAISKIIFESPNKIVGEKINFISATITDTRWNYTREPFVPSENFTCFSCLIYAPLHLYICLTSTLYLSPYTCYEDDAKFCKKLGEFTDDEITAICAFHYTTSKFIDNSMLFWVHYSRNISLPWSNNLPFQYYSRLDARKSNTISGPPDFITPPRTTEPYSYSNDPEKYEHLLRLVHGLSIDGFNYYVKKHLFFDENGKVNESARRNFMSYPLGVSINGTACVGKTTFATKILSVLENCEMTKATRSGNFGGKDKFQIGAMNHQFVSIINTIRGWGNVQDRDAYNNCDWRFIMPMLAKETIEEVKSTFISLFVATWSFTFDESPFPVIIVLEDDPPLNRLIQRSRGHGSDYARSHHWNYVTSQNIVYGVRGILRNHIVITRTQFREKMDYLVELVIEKIMKNKESNLPENHTFLEHKVANHNLTDNKVMKDANVIEVVK